MYHMKYFDQEQLTQTEFVTKCKATASQQDTWFATIT